MFKPVSSSIDFSLLERELLKRWRERGIVEKYLHRNICASKKFSFLDGPITANNPMGVHHAWGRTYKDFWQRFYNMRGYRQRFQNGFDEQGLWVEVEVEKQLGLKSKKDIENLVQGNKFRSLEKFISLCKARVEKFSRIQTEQSKRLGYFMDWENSYHTSSDKNNYSIWNFIKIIHRKGWLYKGRDSVPWCPRCGTAISQHEILSEEYKVLTHKTVVFKLEIKGRSSEFLLAWTTTPWTILGNVALAVDPNLVYWKMKDRQGNKYYLVSPENKEVKGSEMLLHKFNLMEGLEKEEELVGKELINLEYTGPYDNLPAIENTLRGYIHRVVCSDPVILPINSAEGTGIVHVAPGAGTEDFQLGKKEKLPVVDEIDEMGVFLDGFDFISNLPVKQASNVVLQDLEKRNLAFKVADYTHRYPTCWRCNTELVWRVVDEWYISMDSPSKSEIRNPKSEKGKTYREQMIEVAKKINWIPSWGLERELDWLKNMHDWLISKKRYWGLALPIWECHKCGNFEVIGSREELEERVIEGWDKFKRHSPHRPWIDQVKLKCTSCNEKISRIQDVGNPWLDAGIVPFSTMSDDWFPADFITESFPGQFKNWFYSLIAMSTALKREPPFKNILGFATMVDEKGEPFHKSKGNAIEFVEGADKAGADIIRWTCLKANPEQNVLFGYHIADETRRHFYLRLWNVYSFFVTYALVDNWMLSDLNKHFKPSHVLDRWILTSMSNSIKDITESIERYDATSGTKSAEDFVINDLSNWYVRRIRDRVGPSAPDTQDKKDAYQTLCTVLTTYSRVLAPFIPFITDEIYSNLTGEDSVHLADWPEYDSRLMEDDAEKQIDQEMKLARQIVEQAHAKRKESMIKVRQPLASLATVTPIVLSDPIKEIIADEINVKTVVSKKGIVLSVELDTKISPKLKEEGEAREIVRRIQEERKKLGVSFSEKVDVFIENFPKDYEKYIREKSLVDKIFRSSEFTVKKKNA